MSRLDFSAIRASATNRWPEILRALGPFNDAVDAGHHRKTACPFHDGKSGQNFRMFPNWEETGGGICNTCGAFPTGFDLIARAGNLPIYEAFNRVNEFLHGGNAPVVSPGEVLRRQKESSERQAKRDHRLRQQLQDIHASALSAHAPQAKPLRLYVESRGIPVKRFPSSIRYHPSLPYWHKEKDGDKVSSRLLGRFPALVASVMAPDRSIVAFHRIFLNPDGTKADVPAPKRLTGKVTGVNISGAHVPLCDHLPRDTLLITEGIETGFAVQLATGFPVWAAINAQLLESVLIPEGVRRIAIYADLDRSFRGQVAAQALCDRLARTGIECRYYLPPGPIGPDEKGVDWLDIFTQQGDHALPTLPSSSVRSAPASTEESPTRLLKAS